MDAPKPAEDADLDEDGPEAPDGPDEPGSEPPEQVSPVPSVVAVVVARGDAPHLEACLAALVNTDYPDLTVLVIAETEGDLRPRVAEVMPSAFVRSVDVRGFAAGANEALQTVAGAPFLVFLHDDTVCDPDAVRLLVEEAYRSNAAIVGPKVVDVENREILREVGWSVDRFAVPHSEVERNELDQEQHDGVRDVFFVSHVCMLVRADLFGELGGFDIECDPGAAEIDLCWRARLAGARVLIAPDARVGHWEDDDPGDDDIRLAHRHRLRVVLSSTSTARLLWIAPLAFVIHLAEAVAFLAGRRRSRAAALMTAWTWNLGHLGAVVRARRRAQSARVVPDGEVHALQFRGSARIASYMTRSLHADDRVRSLSRRSRTVADSAGTQFRSVRGLVMLGFVALTLIGARDLLIGRVAAVGQVSPWPGAGDLWRAFTSEWRFADLGSHSAAPPLLAVVAGIRGLLLGAGDLGRSLLVAGAIPVAMLGAQRLGRRVAGFGWPGAVAALVYGIIPVGRNAIENGRFGPLMFYAAAPFVVLAMGQLSGLISHRWPRRRIAVLGALALGLSAAAWPLAVAFPLVVVAGFVIAAPFSGDKRAQLRAVGRSALITVGIALLLLFPWPMSFLTGGDHAGSLGIVFDPNRSFGDLISFVTGANGNSIGSWAFVVVGLVVAMLATEDRAAWTARWWGLALVAWCLAALPAWLGSATPEPEGVLVPAALAMAMLAGVGVATFFSEIRNHDLTWRQPLSVAASAAVLLAVLSFVGDAAGGRWHQPERDWVETLDWMHAQRDDGRFRVLWIGDPNVLPGSVHRRGPLGFAIANNGPGDLRDALAPPGGSGLGALSHAVAEMERGATSRFGEAVGAMAVRYVAVPSRPAPSGGRNQPRDDDRLVNALGRQLDLRELPVEPGLRLYENVAWIPGRAVVTTFGPGAARATALSGPVLWSQEYSESWEARGTGSALEHRRVFGWANGFVSTGEQPVAVTFGRQWWRWPALFIETVIVASVAWQALRRGRRARRERRRASSGALGVGS